MIDYRTTVADMLGEAEDMAEELASWRQDFHQFPELAFEEHVTASRIASRLSSLPGVEVTTGFGADTSVVGMLRSDLPGPTVALRSEMDALVLEEETGLPFASCIPGVMHACGHDGHMSALLGAATLLSKRRDELTRPVAFVFQPAEEGRGGGKVLTEAGLMERFNIGSMLGVLLIPSLPYGQLCTRPGVITALSDRMHITVRGTGGHPARPDQAVDPVYVAAHVILALQGIVSRETNPMDSLVISLCQMEAGFAYNIIPAEAHIWGTLRAFSQEVRDEAQSRIEDMVALLCKAHRASSSMEYVRNYPPVENNPNITDRVMELAEQFFDEGTVSTLPGPMLSGEDFSFYSRTVPSCLMMLGTGMECTLHHPRYDLPEDILPMMAAWEAYMAMSI